VRLHSVLVPAKIKVREILIQPAYYIVLTVSLLIGYLIVNGFVNSIDTSGFNFFLNPLYGFFGRTLQGAFGTTLAEKIFSEGPFLFSLYLSYLPVLLFLCYNSLYRFSLDRNTGMVELYSYGPANGSSYFLGEFLKDALFCLLTLLLLLVYFSIAAGVNNLVLGPMFFQALPLLFLFSLSVLAYGILFVSFLDSGSAAIAFFSALQIFFLLLFIGSYSIISDYIRSLSRVLASLIQWVSPIFYLNLSTAAINGGLVYLYIAGMALQLILISALLFGSSILMKNKGVRP
jgi:hypothetical protein